MKRVAEVLKVGRSQAQTARTLAAILGTSTREIGRMVQMERRAGAPICAAADTIDDLPAGFYLASDQDELKAFCAQLFHRGGEIMKTRRALLKTAERMPVKRKAGEDGK